MSAPPRVIYIRESNGHREVVYPLAGREHLYNAYILKSDYDELQTKLTESQRINKVALEAMKMTKQRFEAETGVKGYAPLDNAIKETEGSVK